MSAKVAGYCPMGCGQTLVLVGWGGHVACSLDACPRPDAAADILNDAEVNHIVALGATTFTVRHPLRERLDDELMHCSLHEWIAGLSGPPRKPGTYRVYQAAGADRYDWGAASWQSMAEIRRIGRAYGVPVDTEEAEHRA